MTELAPGPARAPASVGSLDHGVGKPAPAQRTAVRSRWTTAVLVALGVGVLVRFASHSALWLDEAQSVAIARRTVPGILSALHSDGAPPLYYLLLHAWMSVFGESTFAVRALSGVCSVGSLAVMFVTGRRLGGRRVGVAAVLLLASSPFAIRYATEARMYSLVLLLVLLGGEALAWVGRRPGRWPVFAVAAVSGALLLTHYWSLFLVAAVATALYLRWRRDGDPVTGRRLVGVLAGAVVLVPWLPTLVFQLRHTGTPWAHAAAISSVVGAVQRWSGPVSSLGDILALLTVALAVLGALGRARDARTIVLDLRGDEMGRTLGYVVFTTLALAFVVSVALRSGYSTRYTAVALPVYLLLAARGATVLLDERLQRGVLGALVVLGLYAGTVDGLAPRTQAPDVVDAIAARAAPGDLVVFCPDQLGPAVHRLEHADVRELVYPTLGPADRVDWVDYAARNRASDPDAFTEQLVWEEGRNSGIWLVWSPDYVSVGGKCATLANDLRTLRPLFDDVVTPTRAAEHETLTYFPVQ